LSSSIGEKMNKTKGDKKRDRIVSVVITEQELKLIDKLAEKLDLTRSSYLRKIVLKEIKK
jgi:hypothetical protein